MNENRSEKFQSSTKRTNEENSVKYAQISARIFVINSLNKTLFGYKDRTTLIRIDKPENHEVLIGDKVLFTFFSLAPTAVSSRFIISPRV